MNKPSGAFWRDSLAPYEKSRRSPAIAGLFNSLLPYLLLCTVMYFLLSLSLPLALLVGVVAGAFQIRVFTVFHDCTHGSFFSSQKANAFWGSICGFFCFTPYRRWQYEHLVHHGTVSNLDKRGTGDVPVKTVAEYQALSARKQMGYRLYRNPLVMFGVGPLYAMVIKPRLFERGMRPRIRRSVVITNLSLLLFSLLIILLIGWQAYLIIQASTVAVSGGIGIWLFYVQHQFEETTWMRTDNWSFADAALEGSSYLRLPKILQFFSGNIGLHHVHHLSAKVPNYNLQAAHDDNDIFHSVPVLSLWDGLRACRLKLWDEATQQMVTFAHTRYAKV